MVYGDRRCHESFNVAGKEYKAVKPFGAYKQVAPLKQWMHTLPTSFLGLGLERVDELPSYAMIDN